MLKRISSFAFVTIFLISFCYANKELLYSGKIDEATCFEITAELDTQGKWQRCVRMGQKDKLEDVKLTGIRSAREAFGIRIFEISRGWFNTGVFVFPSAKDIVTNGKNATYNGKKIDVTYDSNLKAFEEAREKFREKLKKGENTNHELFYALYGTKP